jgi:hypothetical protein
MAVTVQPSRAATSYKGASWFDRPRSLVPTRTYSAARLVAPARPTIPITGIPMISAIRPTTAKSVAGYDQVVVLTRIDRIGGKLSDPRG